VNEYSYDPEYASFQLVQATDIGALTAYIVVNGVDSIFYDEYLAKVIVFEGDRVRTP